MGGSVALGFVIEVGICEDGYEVLGYLLEGC